MSQSQPQPHPNDDWEKKVLKQVEFYFGDSNYPKDKYLRAQAALDEQGFVQIAVICSFSRMKQLEATDPAKLVDLLRKSSTLVVNEAGTMIRRNAPLPTDVSKTISRTVFTKGWPQELGFEGIESNLSAFGKVVCVRIRKTPEKVSKGSAFVEFETEEQAKELASAGTFKAFDKDIIVKLKQQWYLEKKEKRKTKKDEPNKKRKADNDLEEEMAEKKIKSEDGTEKQVENEGKKEVKKEEKKEKKDEYDLGCILHLKGLADNTTRDMIKQSLSKFGDVKFVEHQFGQKEAFVRMTDGKKAIEQIGDTKLEIATTIVEIRLLEGEEEKTYWQKVKSFSEKKGRNNRKSNRGRRF